MKTLNRNVEISGSGDSSEHMSPQGSSSVVALERPVDSGRSKGEDKMEHLDRTIPRKKEAVAFSVGYYVVDLSPPPDVFRMKA